MSADTTKRNKVKFSAIDVDGQTREFAVLRPSPKQVEQGLKVHNRAFRDAVESGAILRAKVDAILREQNLWNDAKKAEYEKLQARLMENEKKLAGGGIKLEVAKRLAVEMRLDRIARTEMVTERNQLDQKTAEAQAENARFNYYASVCLVYNTDGGMKHYFKDYEDFLARSSEPAATAGAEKLMFMLYGMDSDFEKKLPENKFLTKYGFANDKLQLINKQGKLVDAKGRLVDEDGYFVNDKGERVDSQGTRVNDDGEYVVEFKPFLDDDGKPVGEEPDKQAS